MPSELSRLGIASAGLILGLSAFAVPAAAVGTATPPPSANYQPQDGADPLPPIRARSWLLADADTGQILAERDPDFQLRPASTLKILTALTLMPRLDPNSTYTATQKDVNAPGSRVGLWAGAPYTVKQLFQGLLLPSGNDAAAALANAYGGKERTAAAMNAQVQRLHAEHTSVENSSGLDAGEQRSTARDLAIFFRTAYRIPLFRSIIGTKEMDFPSAPAAGGRSRPTFKIASEDRLLQADFPGEVGGKSGFTSGAGRTFVGAAERNGHTLVWSVMRVETSSATAGKDLLNWGFANYDKLTPVGQLPAADPEPPFTQEAAAQLGADGRVLPAASESVSPNSAAENQPEGVPTGAVAIPDVVATPISGSVTTANAPFLVKILWGTLIVLVLVVALRIRAVVRASRRRTRLSKRLRESTAAAPTEVDLRDSQGSIDIR